MEDTWFCRETTVYSDSLCRYMHASLEFLETKATQWPAWPQVGLVERLLVELTRNPLGTHEPDFGLPLPFLLPRTCVPRVSTVGGLSACICPWGGGSVEVSVDVKSGR